MNLPEPIFSIDLSEAKQYRFKVKCGDVVYNGTIELDADGDSEGWRDCSYFTLKDQDGNKAPDEVMEDDSVIDGFNEIKDNISGLDYWPFEPLKPILPESLRAAA